MEFRKATGADLPAIVAMLADDELGATRERYEDPLPKAYVDAFVAMRRQGDNDIILAVDGGEIVGCLQLTLIAGLSRLGMTRAQIEGVRVDRRHRGKGVGEILLNRAIELARREASPRCSMRASPPRDSPISPWSSSRAPLGIAAQP